jgi:hypothetical protein
MPVRGAAGAALVVQAVLIRSRSSVAPSLVQTYTSSRAAAFDLSANACCCSSAYTCSTRVFERARCARIAENGSAIVRAGGMRA